MESGRESLWNSLRSQATLPSVRFFCRRAFRLHTSAARGLLLREMVVGEHALIVDARICDTHRRYLICDSCSGCIPPDALAPAIPVRHGSAVVAPTPASPDRVVGSVDALASAVGGPVVCLANLACMHMVIMLPECCGIRPLLHCQNALFGRR